MRITFLLLLITIFNYSYSQSTKIVIQNPNNSKLTFFDFIHQDSLFSSVLNNDSFEIENDRNTRVIIVLNSDYLSKYNVVILDESTMKIDFNDYYLKFEHSTTNQNYQKFLLQREFLKSNEKERSLYTYNFMKSIPESIISLDYIKNSLIYSLHSKDSCKILLNNIAEKLQTNKLWYECNELLKDIQYLKKGSELKSITLFNMLNNIEEEVFIKDKTILLFWASWCKPCIDEIELFKKNKHLFSSFNILLINMDKKLDEGKIVINKFDLLNYNNYYLENVFNNSIARSLKITSLPKNVFTLDGNIVDIKTDLFNCEKLEKNIYFDSNDFSMNIQNNQMIKNLIDSMGLELIKSIVLVGMADTIGDINKNKELSNKRVELVKTSILSISNKLRNKIQIYSRGEVKEYKQLSKNRRVNIQIEFCNTEKIYKQERNFIDVKIGEKLLLPNIQFEGSKDYPTNNSYSDLKYLKDFLLANVDYKIDIQGHVDLPIGWKGFDYNDLSERRAGFVYKYLLKGGINRNRLNYQGYGGSKPIVEPGTKNSYLNRRVEIIRVK